MDPERGREIPSTQRPRRHDELVSELGLWYARSVPEMGFYVKERRFGFYQRQKDTGRVRATVRHLPVGDVERFLQDLREYFWRREYKHVGCTAQGGRSKGVCLPAGGGVAD